MKKDVFDYLYQKNLETYFDNLELLRQRGFTSSVRWDANLHFAAERNRNLDEHFYVDMWKDHSSQFIKMIQDLASRPTTMNRVILPSKMNQSC